MKNIRYRWEFILTVLTAAMLMSGCGLYTRYSTQIGH